jgi:hypothetical protein
MAFGHLPTVLFYCGGTTPTPPDAGSARGGQVTDHFA